jgi:hypothetical protein
MRALHFAKRIVYPLVLVNRRAKNNKPVSYPGMMTLVRFFIIDLAYSSRVLFHKGKIATRQSYASEISD